MSNYPLKQVASTTHFGASDDEVNLGQMVSALMRHRPLIATVAGTSLLMSVLFAFLSKPMWEGQFQIVLDDQSSSSDVGKLSQLAANNPFLSNLSTSSAKFSSQSSLKTEVKILESPSILKPVYEFVVREKLKAKEKVDDLKFADWREDNVSIELIKDTSVLNITYRDSNKSLILPAINLMSQAYQAYSGRDRSRSLTQGVNYLEEQLRKLKLQSNKSMKAAQTFALSNRLDIQVGSMEANREATQNKVNALKQQLTTAKAAGTTGVYVAPQIEANARLFAKLQDLKVMLQQKSALLRVNDPSVKSLERQIQTLTQVINQQTIGLLEGQLQTANAQLTSLTRPREVVLKHRELVRTALRDEETVAKLDTQLQTLLLEKARQTDPWELISTPTLLDKPVAPRKRRILALGLLAGIVAGSGAALIVDRRKGLVFSVEELKKLMPCPLIEQLPATGTDTWTDAADLLAAGPFAEVNENGAVALIPIGNVPSDQIQAFSTKLSSALKGRKLLVSSDLLETSRSSTQLLITSTGVVTRIELIQFRQKLALQGAPVAGWVLLDPNLKIG